MKGKKYQVFKEFQKGSFLGVFTEKELKVLLDLRNQMMIKNDIERRLRGYRRISIGSMAKRLKMHRNAIRYILKKLQRKGIIHIKKIQKEYKKKETHICFLDLEYILPKIKIVGYQASARGGGGRGREAKTKAQKT